MFWSGQLRYAHSGADEGSVVEYRETRVHEVDNGTFQYHFRRPAHPDFADFAQWEDLDELLRPHSPLATGDGSWLWR